jgi:hypothetical protein
VLQTRRDLIEFPGCALFADRGFGWIELGYSGHRCDAKVVLNLARGGGEEALIGSINQASYASLAVSSLWAPHSPAEPLDFEHVANCGFLHEIGR